MGKYGSKFNFCLSLEVSKHAEGIMFKDSTYLLNLKDNI